MTIHFTFICHILEFAPATQFAYQKRLGTCDALLCVSYTLQSALGSGQEARIVQIDFRAPFDTVNHLGISYTHCSMGIGGSVLYILTQFLRNKWQHDMVDGSLSKLVNVVSGVQQRGVLCPLFFLLYTTELFPFCIWISWSVIPMTPLCNLLCNPQALRVTVTESLNRDLGMVSEWCDLRGMKLIVSKTIKDYDSLQCLQ